MKMKKTLKIGLAILLISFAAFAFTPEKLIVTSSAFNQNGMIPAKYSCEGAEVSPPLKVSNIPTGTKSLAIIVHEPDAPKFGGVTHWVIWNLPVSGQIAEGFKGAMPGWNSDDKPGYKGMCPPDGPHHYNFRVYALNAMLSLPANTDKAGLEKAIQGHIVAEGLLTGLYTKTKSK
jgi:hypothetical protein